AIDNARKAKRVTLVPLVTNNSPFTKKDLIENQVVMRDSYRQVVNELFTMKKNYQEIIILRGILELSVKECAEILHCTENKVNVTFHRALAKLREQLKRKEVIFYEETR